MSTAASQPEISDLIIDYDPDSLERRVVDRARVLSELQSRSMHGAAKIVASWPHRDGVLDAAFVDGVLLRSHLELQRLSEEFRQGERALSVLGPLIATDMTQPVHEKYDRLISGGLTPISRWGTPEDIGKAVAALAQDALPFSTGEVLNVDGGFHLRIL